MSRHSLVDNLRVIAEYATFDDTAKVFGIPKKHLKAVINGRAEPHPDLIKYAAEVASRIRRHDAQLKRYVVADVERKARREIRNTLRLVGKPDLKIPDYLPPLLRYHDSGRFNAPVFIYDFRGITYEQVKDFFRFMKSVMPKGYFFLTYNLITAGITSEKEGLFFTDALVEQLKIIHKTKNPIKAIRDEVGTAAAYALISKVKSGYIVHGVHAISTQYQAFCEIVGPGTCVVRSDNNFANFWSMFNDRSIGQEVIECGLTYDRPLDNKTEAEIALDEERGADPLTGMVYLWEDE